MKKLICPLCGEPGLVIRKNAVSVALADGRQGRLPAVVHQHCPHCGENFYAYGSLPNLRRRKPRLKKAG